MAGHIDIDHGNMDDCPNACASTWAQRCQPFDTMPCNLMPFIHRSYMPLNGRKMDPKISGRPERGFADQRNTFQHFRVAVINQSWKTRKSKIWFTLCPAA